jgi:hypothetical protein
MGAGKSQLNDSTTGRYRPSLGQPAHSHNHRRHRRQRVGPHRSVPLPPAADPARIRAMHRHVLRFRPRAAMLPAMMRNYPPVNYPFAPSALPLVQPPYSNYPTVLMHPTVSPPDPIASGAYPPMPFSTLAFPPSMAYPRPMAAATPAAPWSQPAFNNAPMMAPTRTGLTAVPSMPFSAGPRNLPTDWTGGGVISPGFLGPPL